MKKGKCLKVQRLSLQTDGQLWTTEIWRSAFQSPVSLKATRMRRWVHHSFPSQTFLLFITHPPFESSWSRTRKMGSKLAKCTPPTFWFYLKRILTVCKILIKGRYPTLAHPWHQASWRSVELRGEVVSSSPAYCFRCLCVLILLGVESQA